MAYVKPHPTKEGYLLIRGNEYAQVQVRVKAFRKAYPIETGWAIVSELLEDSERCIWWRATIVNPEGVIVANGDKRTIAGKDKLEVCQTGAIGRALYFAGFGDGQIASAEDMVEFLDSENQPPDLGPPAEYFDAVWDQHTTAEVEAFNESTKDYGMTMREHLALTSKLGKQPPWEMTPANRMKYAKWLGTKRGLKARGVAA